MRAAMSAGKIAPSRFSATRAAAASLSGFSSMLSDRGRSPHLGRFSSRSGREVASSRIVRVLGRVEHVLDAGRGTPARPSGCRRSARPAVRSAASFSRNLRAAQLISCSANAPSLRPIAEAMPRGDVLVVDQRGELGARLLRAVVGAHLGGAVGDVAQRPERDAVAVGQAAALDDARTRHRRATSPRAPAATCRCRRRRRS